MSVLQNLSVGLGDEAGLIIALQKDVNKTDTFSTDVLASVTAASPTLTAAQLLGGKIALTTQAATTATTATAALLVAAVSNVAVGDAFDITIRNGNTGVLTVAGGSGVTLSGNAKIAVGGMRVFHARFTNVTASSEAVTITSVMASHEPEPATSATAVTDVGNATLTAEQLVNGFILRSGSSTPTDVMPTAAQFVAAFPNATTASAFEFTIRNAGSGVATLGASTGVTLTGTTTVTNAKARRYIGQFTNVTAASEAVTITALPEAAF